MVCAWASRARKGFCQADHPLVLLTVTLSDPRRWTRRLLESAGGCGDPHLPAAPVTPLA